MLIPLGACAKPLPAAFEVTSLVVTPLEVTAGETVSVTAEVKNTGGTEGTYTAILTLDGKEIGKETVLIGPGAMNTAVFKLTSPETDGDYKLSVGEANANLQVFPWVASTIQYDNAKVNQYYTFTEDVGNGFLSYFQIPSSTFRIKDINIYGFIGGSDRTGLEKRSFTLRIWDKKLSQELYSQSYPYNLFTTSRAWVKVQVPDLRVDSDFCVEVDTNAEGVVGKVKCGLYVGLDVSATEGNTDLILNGVVQPWETTLGAKETAAWMVRVEGERGPKVQRYTLSYDDGIHEEGYYTDQQSYLVYFSPPSKPFRITQILIYGGIQADSLADYQNAEFSVKVYNKTGKELWAQNFPWQLFSLGSAKWVGPDAPNIAVSDDFYVEVTTYSGSKPMLYIDFDSSTPNEHSDMSVNGKIIPWKTWTWKGITYTREKVNWMIRVVGTGMIPES
jgi:hypothetical protein